MKILPVAALAASMTASCAFLPPIDTDPSRATLSDLVRGATLSVGDVTFRDFRFDDRFGRDRTGGLRNRTDTPLPGDRIIDASAITVTTSSTASTVTLRATIAPGVAISGASGELDHIYDAFFDASVVVRDSERTITGVTLQSGDLSASGNAVSEVIFDIRGMGGGNDLEIFEAPAMTPASQPSDTRTIEPATTLDLVGQIEGETASGASAGLSSFSLTFTLAGTSPAPPTGPRPAPSGLP